MSEPRDFYAQLGVEKGANTDEIKKAYRALARKWHPDVNPGKPDAEQRFKEVSAAYEVLSNPDKRKLYDEFGEAGLREGFDPEQARAYQDWHARRTASGARGFDEQPFDLGDLEGFFRRDPRPRRAAPGADLRAVVELDLRQAIEGSEVRLEVPDHDPCEACNGSGAAPNGGTRTCLECQGRGQRPVLSGPLQFVTTCPACAGTGKIATPCPSCNGRGFTESTQTLTVRIPPGADDGETLTVKGRGMPGPGGGPRGDVVIETRVRPHPHFRREGLDLFVTLPVTLHEAYAGGHVDVPTPDGNVRLRIPARSHSGTRLRLRNKGVSRKGARGDLYVELSLRVPDQADAELVRALEAAATLYGRPVREGVAL